MCEHTDQAWVQLGADNKCFQIMRNPGKWWYTEKDYPAGSALKAYLVLLKPKHPVVRVCCKCELILEEAYEL